MKGHVYKKISIGSFVPTKLSGWITIPAATIPWYAEYAYYGIMLNTVFGFVTVPLLGAASMAGLAVFCVFRLRRFAACVYRPIALPLMLGVSFIIIQIVFHEDSIMGAYNRVFVTWIFALIITQSLYLRQGFLHRFSIACIVLAVFLLPHLAVSEVTSDYERSGLDKAVGLNNPNDLAAWFGFCCVYVIVVAIETRRNVVRILSLSLAAGFLLVVGLTVSRTALGAIAVATIIALRRVFRRGFVPVLLFTVICAIALVSGLFDHAIGLYAGRGAEESGRFLVWPIAVEEFGESFFAGRGALDSDIYVAVTGEVFSPHNGFLFIGLASGILPLLLFLACWWKAGRNALSAVRARTLDAPFLLPLVPYAFFIMFSSNQTFMYPWAVVTLIVALSAGPSLRLSELLVKKEKARSGVPNATFRRAVPKS